MDWEGKDATDQAEDSRGAKPAMAVGGGIGAMVIMAIAYFVGIDPNQAKQIANQIAPKQQADGPATPLNDRMNKFSNTMLTMNNMIWKEEFEKMGKRYEKPGMKLFSEEVNTGCGRAPSAVGPFYCPADKKVYLDPTFFETLEKQLGGSKADFSMAYVIAHEVGHHVQNLLGYNALLDRFEGEGKNAGIRLELQADYLAGVWAKHANDYYDHKLINEKDIEDALLTAKKIGDDAIQKKTQGWTSPESYTHGSAAQRYKYFTEGLKTGDSSKAALDRFFNPRVKALDL